MNIEQLNKLSAASRQAYMDAERFYGSKGWAKLKEWLIDQKLQAEQRASYADTWEINRLNIGAALMLNQILAAEDLAFQAFDEELENALEGEDPDAGDIFL